MLASHRGILSLAKTLRICKTKTPENWPRRARRPESAVALFPSSQTGSPFRFGLSAPRPATFKVKILSFQVSLLSLSFLVFILINLLQKPFFFKPIFETTALLPRSIIHTLSLAAIVVRSALHIVDAALTFVAQPSPKILNCQSSPIPFSNCKPSCLLHCETLADE